MFKRSERLNQAAVGRSLDEGDPDSSATNAPETELDAYEVFESGFELAVKAAGRDVWAVLEEEETTVFFFIGTEEDVLARILASPGK